MLRPRIYLALAVAGCTAHVSSVGRFPDHPLTATRELSIGSVDDPQLSFTWFRDLEVGPDGTIFTLHPQEHTIRVYDSTGRFVRTIGREGKGPGEFSNAYAMGLLGDTLWVQGNANRFDFFDLDGRLLGSRTVPIDLGGPDMAHSPPRPTGLLSDGSIMGQSPTWSHLVVRGEITSTAVLRLDTTSAVLDTIVAYSVANSQWEVADPNNAGGPHIYRYQPFSDAPLVEVSQHLPRAVVVDRHVPPNSEEPVFRVTALRLDGDTLFSRAFAYDPIEITAGVVDSLVNATAKQLSEMPNAPAAGRLAEWARATLYVPKFRPPVTQLVVGRDGSIWLAAERTNAATIGWRVLSPDGDPVGIVKLPGRFSPMLVDGEHVWGAFYDELGIPYIVRYRIAL
jgi:hypothetical protein